MASLTTRRIAALGATTLVAGALTLAASPAQAKSDVLTYDCNVPILGAKVFEVVVDTNAPTTLAAGASATLQTTADITVPADMADAMRNALAVASIDGTVDATASINGVAGTSTLTVAKTLLPTEAGSTLTAKASGPGGTITAAADGTLYVVTAGNFTAHINTYKADGSSAGAFEIPCVLQAGQDGFVDALNPVATTSTTKATYNTTMRKAVLKATVAAESGKPSGEVTFVVKRDGAKVKSFTVELNAKGVAKAVYKNIKKPGKYTVLAKYAGAKEFAKSKAKTVSFKVK